MRRLIVALVVLLLALGPGSMFATTDESPAGTFEPERLATADAREVQAHSLLDQGDYQGARDLEKQVFEARTRILGPDHPDTLRAKGILAVTLAALDEASPESTD